MNTKEQKSPYEELETEEILFCGCGNRGEWRVCPYTLELSGRAEEDISPCSCCKRCASQCALDI